MSLTQLVWIMHNNMQGSWFEPRPPQKKKKKPIDILNPQFQNIFILFVFLTRA